MAPFERLADLEHWLRANASVISLFPAALWLLKESILRPHDRRGALLSTLPLVVIGALCGLLCYHRAFLRQNGHLELIKGSAYYYYISTLILLLIVCLVGITTALRQSSGLRRLELQFLALNAVCSAFMIGILNALGNLISSRPLNRIGILIGLISTIFTAWAVIVYKIFNAREFLLKLGQRGSVIVVLTGGSFLIWWMTSSIMTHPFNILFSTSLCYPLAIWFDRKSRRWFRAPNVRKGEQIQQKAISLSRSESDTETMISRFEEMLCCDYNSSMVRFLSDSGLSYTSSVCTVDKHSLSYTAFKDIGWATPESLERRRSSPGLAHLSAVLRDNGLGLLLAVPKSSPVPSLLVAIGVKKDGDPFTYPEVEILHDIALLMDSLISRSQIAKKAAMQARIDHLAIMSRGMAHDLKNLITPVASFLVHTQTRYGLEGEEAAVHAAASRSVGIMTDYVRETLFFSEYREPRFERVDIAELLLAAAELVSDRARKRAITIHVQHTQGVAVSADRVLLQRLLGNLLHNAIEASKDGGSILLVVQKPCAGWIRIEVRDHGCGIPEENLSRIFEPYFTTKEFGDDVRGFGLGLTICQKIVQLHNGRISVKSAINEGTLFLVDLPLEPALQKELPRPTP